MNNYFFIVILLLLFSCSTGNNNMLKEVKKIETFPSASGIEYFKNHLYVIGDDASQILVLDSNFHPVDSIRLFSATERRVAKSIKPDLEAITLLPDKKLFVIGSGSLSPHRNKGWIIDPVSKKADSIRLDSFYARLTAAGLPEINIEGICRIPGYFIISNRGNLSYPKNHLILAHKTFWEEQSKSSFSVIRFGNNTDSSSFNGVSGLSYSEKSDKLLVTVSTEYTKSSYEDGAIGKSFLWIIDDFSTKKRWAAINPNKSIDLEKLDKRFSGQKIESVCIMDETKHFLHLVLAADNDDGSSTLFKIIVEKK